MDKVIVLKILLKDVDDDDCENYLNDIIGYARDILFDGDSVLEESWYDYKD